ncbi:histidine kinase [Pseudomonas entomophila]|uniref:histidine kinase n=1 Tax=Pseudomonas entomophila TaxID=312306 RepID=UPI0023D7EC7A|nr:histidine kinase [Pseudomonas entomophila]MDF0732452.1 histidine kinase [Pseudomonas entomophila]
MERAPSNSALQDFLLDAQVLLTQCQECLLHLELITNDPDACHGLNDSLGTLARRAEALALFEVAQYSADLQRLLAPACTSGRLQGDALNTVDACLTLLAWQLELVDPHTGRLNLDTTEQQLLLGELASALGRPSPQSCAPPEAADHAPTPEHPPQQRSAQYPN